MTAPRWRPALLLAGIVLLALLPLLQVSVPGVLPGPTSTAGTLQLLAVCLLIGALALSYQLLFGLAGLLSFGHALYFAVGCYVFAIVLNTWQLGIGPAALLTLAIGTLAALLVGAISLRVRGISFAMVTLAFAQAVRCSSTGTSAGTPAARRASVSPAPTCPGPWRVSSTRRTSTGPRWRSPSSSTSRSPG
jgi:branched-chain amino acid transport system permease protein